MRTKSEIQTEYQKEAMELGDFMFKVFGSNPDVIKKLNHFLELKKEVAEIEKLEKEFAEFQATKSGS